MCSSNIITNIEGRSRKGRPFLLHTTAGQSIIIGQGFVTTPGSIFTAEIGENGGCQTPGIQSFKTSPNNTLSFDNSPISKNVNGMKVYAYPNPTSDVITVGASNNNYQNISFMITDISGRFMGQYDNPVVSGSNIEQTMDVSSYASGIYIITAVADGQKYSFKISKQ